MTEDFFASLSGLDYVVLGVVVLLVILGFRRGFSGELGRLAGVLASAATLFFGYKPIAAWVDGLHIFQNSALATKLLVLICLLVLCISVWLLVKKLLSDAVKTILKQPFDAILGGDIIGAPTKMIPYFDLEVPTALTGVDPAILDPRDTYADPAVWEEKAKDLASRFIKNFKKYEDNDAGKALAAAGPHI